MLRRRWWCRRRSAATAGSTPSASKRRRWQPLSAAQRPPPATCWNWIAAHLGAEIMRPERGCAVRRTSDVNDSFSFDADTDQARRTFVDHAAGGAGAGRVHHRPIEASRITIGIPPTGLLVLSVVLFFVATCYRHPLPGDPDDPPLRHLLLDSRARFAGRCRRHRDRRAGRLAAAWPTVYNGRSEEMFAWSRRALCGRWRMGTLGSKVRHGGDLRRRGAPARRHRPGAGRRAKRSTTIAGHWRIDPDEPGAQLAECNAP